MTINHLNLVVTDVSKTTQFFETYFSFNCELLKGDNVIAVLKNAENFTLVIMSNKNGDTNYPKDFHVGFMVGSSEEVEAIYRKLTEGNIEISQPPRKIRDSFGFYFYFDNLFIEIGHYLEKGKMEFGAQS